jgi:biotin carboxyl carrier protein
MANETLFSINDRQFELAGELPDVIIGPDDSFIVADGSTLTEVFVRNDNTLSDGFAFDGTQVQVEQPRDRIIRERFSGIAKGGAGSGGHYTMKAPMPGLVKKILVAVGDQVSRQTPIVILEAMKMENVLTAGKQGVLAEIKVLEGRNVEKNAVLCVIEEE